MLLKKVAASHSLGSVLTLGRQNLEPGAVRRTLNDGRFEEDIYCERLLTDYFGATAVDSLDFSDFEGASHIADLNTPVRLEKPFDTVIDFGTTEHIFAISMALENCIRLCRPGGVILHTVPSNGENGHGFYQLSPELFFSLYSEENGFAETQVYLAETMNEKHWWKATPPAPGERLMANSLISTYVLVSTRKVRDVPALSVNQSDYRHAWDLRLAHADLPRDTWGDRARAVLRRSPFRHLGSIAYRGYAAPTGLTRFNRCLTRVPIQRTSGNEQW